MSSHDDSKLKILLIDDNPDDRILVRHEVRKVLEHAHIDEIGEKQSFEEALASGAHWDVAVTDFDLQWGTGLEVFQRMKTERPGMPVIMFTASGTEEIAVAALQQGVADYITKTPRHYGRVPYAIRSAAERRRGRLESERAAAELQRNEALLTLALEAASMETWEFDNRTLMLDVHGRCPRVFGSGRSFSLDELLSHVHEDDVDRLRSEYLETTQGGKRFDCEFRVVAQGHVRWLRSAGIRSEADKLVGVLEDITRRRQLVERLRESDLRKDQFIATLGHELRNPLAPIRYAASMLATQPQPAVVARVASIIERQTGAMSKLIDQLLDLSRISNGLVELHRETMDLRPVVLEAADDAGPTAKAAGLLMAASVPEVPVWVEGDALRLKQVLDNLLSNAVKYTAAGGHVEVSLESAGDDVVVRVMDTGVGIPADMRERIFEPLVQLHAGPGSPQQGGLGIGLALVKDLVRRHAGEVRVWDRAGQTGSVFEVRLPAAPASAAPPLK